MTQAFEHCDRSRPPTGYRRRAGRLLTRVMALLLFSTLVTGCYDGPTQKDVQSPAYLAYPGAKVTSRSWEREKHGRYIDSGRFDSQARLSFSYQLPGPTDSSQLRAWYETQLTTAGWKDCWPPSANRSLEIAYCNNYGNRLHDLSIWAPDKGAVNAFSVDYNIGFKGSTSTTSTLSTIPAPDSNNGR